MLQLSRNASLIACLGAVLASGVGGAADEIAPTEVDGSISWVYDYAEGKRLSRQSGKPMMVVFRCER